jgi:hypothetical protein
MKPQQLISAGFAITALAAASIPTLGWTLLGEVIDPPAAAAQYVSDSPPLFGEASRHAVTVALALPAALERDQTLSP